MQSDSVIWRSPLNFLMQSLRMLIVLSISCGLARSAWERRILPARDTWEHTRYLEELDRFDSNLESITVMTLPMLYQRFIGSSFMISKNSSTSNIPDGSIITRSYPSIPRAISLVFKRLLWQS